jgi:glutathionylspermidine synthase
MEYLAALAREAGLGAEFIALPDIGYDHDARQFVDLADRPIVLMAKHHPWQWLLRDPFGESLLEAVAADHLEVIEPAWRLVLSNKAILEVLWERYPFHPNLARAERDWRAFVEGTAVTAKPRFGLNAGGVGQGMVAGGRFDGPAAASEGFGAEGYVYQQTVPLAEAGGRHAVFDVWMVNGEAMGMGIREAASPVIDRGASFVPHRFTP